MTQGAHSQELTVEEIKAVAGGNIIQEAGQAVLAWFLGGTCGAACAQSKGQIQGELARFR
ncbi:hypothetical protein [Bradyrhizobium sp. JYMT SZCCT0428]|uniref:hypothetical protein n=1 Tax=Bradyrhizobium sp. JYMT SZCCT0428 TaxID=2807673 RepID=UPI001BA69359|nr:hypothetical protein [Bradyrhizobium sp. JYMT SZCCT0428]MBR1157169.1 hypothetical protein [Bradyrhizobium sp. JYMT SZCCT0428]